MLIVNSSFFEDRDIQDAFVGEGLLFDFDGFTWEIESIVGDQIIIVPYVEGE
jgi:hypothetical protein